MKRWSLRLIPFLVLTLFLGAAGGEGVGIEKFFLVIIAMLILVIVDDRLVHEVSKAAVLTCYNG